MSKIIFITGSTDGIGKLAAIKFAKSGHKIYLHGRNPEKLANTIKEIKAETSNKNIKGYIADLSDFDAVNKMADLIASELPIIDVLINNAGVFKSNNPVTKDGLDIRFVVNYLAPVLLTNKLLPLLKKSNEAQIINLSSAAQSSVSMDALNGKTHLSDQVAYAQSKLAILMWSFYLAKTEPNISIIALNPGSLLNTKMVKEAYGRFWSAPDKGANIIYDIATVQTHKGITGKYFDNDAGGYGNAHTDAYDDIKIKHLIEHTNKLGSN